MLVNHVLMKELACEVSASAASIFEVIVALNDQHAVFEVRRQMRFHEAQIAVCLKPRNFGGIEPRNVGDCGSFGPWMRPRSPAPSMLKSSRPSHSLIVKRAISPVSHWC